MFLLLGVGKGVLEVLFLLLGVSKREFEVLFLVFLVKKLVLRSKKVMFLVLIFEIGVKKVMFLAIFFEFRDRNFEFRVRNVEFRVSSCKNIHFRQGDHCISLETSTLSYLWMQIHFKKRFQWSYDQSSWRKQVDSVLHKMVLGR